ncbi:hypothetical protein [Stenotrophomonas sp. YIM B06876]|uniref:hypothetical protein n=1 Tax=Stenotrophomonas sp. YIM B06876 TaxID=3060211 RepID=UPI00273854C0|nr:hypothetical protein [Stenotrophomonas sp. YIM B06876]
MGSEFQIPGRVPERIDREAVSRYWHERFSTESYYTSGDRFEDFEPAYLAGHEARVRDFNRAYEQVEAELEARWQQQHAASSPLGWAKARLAVRRAWDEAAHLYGGGAAGNKK